MGPASEQNGISPDNQIPPTRGGRWLAILCGILAALAVILTLDGPGLTVDEPLDVRPGRNYLRVLREQGRYFLHRKVVDQVYGDNAEHPPLGRWLLGIASVSAETFEVLLKGPDPTGSYVLAGRLAPALAFGILVGLVASVGMRHFGLPAGLAAAFALLTMPRVFAHAHLAALDTFLSCTWTAALLAGDRALRSRRPARAMIGAGAVWSLALLTKIHAWFLVPMLGIWSLVRLPPRRAGAAMAVWIVTGIALFWAGWPWLWYDSWARLWRFWGTGVQRTTIRVQYLGQVYLDRDVPWHYPWIYFLGTVPVGFQALGALGIMRGWRDRRREPLPVLLAGSIAFFLILFSTRVPVYDGERLFLHVFPAWALLVGHGFGWLYDRMGHWRRARGILVALVLTQCFGVLQTYPFGLSYYNRLVGGLPGAERLGLEVTYWNDAVDDDLLDRLAQDCRSDATAALLPTLYEGQGAMTTGFNRTLARRGIVLQDDTSALDAEWVVASYRTAYWPAAWWRRLEQGGGRLIAVRSRQGVALAAIWQFPNAGSHTPPGRSPTSRSDQSGRKSSLPSRISPGLSASP